MNKLQSKLTKFTLSLEYDKTIQEVKRNLKKRTREI